MNELCKRRNTCRLCNKTNLKLAFSLEPTPPANAFVDKQKTTINQDCYPLDIFFCEDCNHVQTYYLKIMCMYLEHRQYS